MGAKRAGIHLRYTDREETLVRLKERFDRDDAGKRARAEENREVMENFLRLDEISGIEKEEEPKEEPVWPEGVSEITLSSKEVMELCLRHEAGRIRSEEERKEELAWFEEMLKASEDADTEKATVIVRGDFISVYWYDVIRYENLRGELEKYAALCGVPALGAGIYDDDDFFICAVSGAGTPECEKCFGEYNFAEDDISPAKPGELCKLVEAPSLLLGLARTLRCGWGDEMAETFTKETGLEIFVDGDMAGELGMRKLYDWKGAAVYAAGSASLF